MKDRFPDSPPMIVALDKTRLFVAGLAGLILLNLGNASAHYLLANHPSGFANALEALFDFDREGNLSTLYNGLLLLGAALLAGMIALWRREMRGPGWLAWTGIALIFAFLFVDELCGLHDSLDFVLQERMVTSGAFAWPWVIAYGALTLVVAVVYLPFFLRLPRRFQFRFGFAALLYVGGAIGLEMLAAGHASEHGDEGGLYTVFVAIEETLEMLAFLLVGHSLIHYLERECPGFQLSLHPAAGGGSDESPDSHPNTAAGSVRSTSSAR